ncbi:MAG: bifunctional 5,10-methylene-tetrahydrofolate dehydrogenase/5,10-methylene-tetrahydrofolate cyclohydrolase, partial [Thermoproteota archaeon]|nr:bifunctional 5,10-methylene-tetrahydrofolate dehydrogenase/5,10-methylene-tetrahydrofolate cyclohydrolase [Thermoproteota archaeon]
MVARLIDGKVVSADVKSRVMRAVRELNAIGVRPCLTTVLVGDDPASATYIESKHKDAKEVGIVTRDHRLGATFNQKE